MNRDDAYLLAVGLIALNFLGIPFFGYGLMTLWNAAAPAVGAAPMSYFGACGVALSAILLRFTKVKISLGGE